MSTVLATIALGLALRGGDPVAVRTEQRCPMCPAITVAEHAPSDSRYPGTTSDKSHGAKFGAGLGGMRDNAISFVRVPEGFDVTLYDLDYRQTAFGVRKGVGGGESISFTGPYEGELPPRMNDKTSLILVVQTRPCRACGLAYDRHGGYKLRRSVPDLATLRVGPVLSGPCEKPELAARKAERERQIIENDHQHPERDHKASAEKVIEAKERANKESDKAKDCKDGKEPTSKNQ